MKHLKHFVLASFAAFAMMSCSQNDGLQKDVDALKERVTTLELLANQVNNNINTVRQLLTKSIQNAELVNGVWKITLSDNTVLELKQGSEGTVAQPAVVSITPEGYWKIGDQVTTVKATATDGKTPKFQVSTENYWQVSFDDGATWTNVLQDGKPIAAVPAPAEGGGDTFFTDVKKSEDGKTLIVTLASSIGGGTYNLPIVSNLVCQIMKEGVARYDAATNTLQVEWGKTVELKVNIDGDNASVIAPQGWLATLSEPVDKVATLTLTAPAMTSRASADNTKDLTVQVYRNGFIAVDKMMVVGAEAEKSYLQRYNEGLEAVQVGTEGVKGTISLNVNNFGAATEVKDGETINAPGVYYLQSGATVTLALDQTAAAAGVTTPTQTKLVLFTDGRATVNVANTIYLGGTNATDDKGVVAKNIDFVTDIQPMFKENNPTTAITLDNFVMDHCSVSLNSTAQNNNNFTYFAGANITTRNISIQNSLFKVATNGSTAMRFLNWDKSTGVNGDVISVVNNIVVCPQVVDNKSVNSTFIFNKTNPINVTTVAFNNNTLINMPCTSNALLNAAFKGACEAKDNVLFCNTNVAFYLYNTADNITLGENIFYNPANASASVQGKSDKANLIQNTTENPLPAFTADTDWWTVVSPTGKGAKLNK